MNDPKNVSKDDKFKTFDQIFPEKERKQAFLDAKKVNENLKKDLKALGMDVGDNDKIDTKMNEITE